MLKPQGKINKDIVIQGLLANKKKKDIAVEAGSMAVSDDAKVKAINQVVKSSEFKQKALPFIERLKIQRDRMLDAIDCKDLTEAELRDLTGGVDKFTKNIELLSGNATDRSAVVLNVEKQKEIEKALEDL